MKKNIPGFGSTSRRMVNTNFSWIQVKKENNSDELYMIQNDYLVCVMFYCNFEGEEIRFKVIEECFIDTTPSAPGSEAPDSSLDPIKDNKKMSYRIQVKFQKHATTFLCVTILFCLFTFIGIY